MAETAEAEAFEAKTKLGIGISVEDRIAKLERNGFQYATAGDTKALISEIDRLKAELERARVREQELADEANRLLDEVKASDKKVFYLTAEVEIKDRMLVIAGLVISGKISLAEADAEARAALSVARQAIREECAMECQPMPGEAWTVEERNLGKRIAAAIRAM